MNAGPLGSTFDPHSPEALAIATLFGQTLIVCGIIGVVVAGLVGTCIVRFREGKRPGEPAQNHGNRSLEITWTLIPLAIVIGLSPLNEFWIVVSLLLYAVVVAAWIAAVLPAGPEPTHTRSNEADPLMRAYRPATRRT